MKKDIQDRIWQCLPKEARGEIKTTYYINLNGNENYSKSAIWNEGSACLARLKLLEYLFGKHNITSDTEPEDEMLFYPRKDVQEFYAEICKTIVRSQNTNMRIYSQGKIIALKSLFGDKCLPDKESRLCDKCINESQGYCKVNIGCDGAPRLINDRKSCDAYKPKEEPKPKFKVGDIVKVNNTRYNQHFGATGVIKSIEEFVNGIYTYTLENDVTFSESSLEPYTEEYEIKQNKTQELSLSEKQETENKEECSKKPKVLFDCLSESQRLKVLEKYHEYIPMAFNGFAVGYCAALRDVFGSDNLPIIK